MSNGPLSSASIKYIFASSRTLYSGHFAEISSTASEAWRVVATPKDLEMVLAVCAPIYIFFVHWNWKVPESIFTRYECVCFHMTDVPYGRGGSPLQNLILRGHGETVVTALRMVAELDAGPVYCKRPLSLAGRAEDIFLRAGSICLEIMRWMIACRPVPVAQSGKPVLFARRNPEQSELPAAGTLAQLYDFVRMLDAPGYPRAFIKHGTFCLEFSHARLCNGELAAQVFIRPYTDSETSI